MPYLYWGKTDIVGAVEQIRAVPGLGDRSKVKIVDPSLLNPKDCHIQIYGIVRILNLVKCLDRPLAICFKFM